MAKSKGKVKVKFHFPIYEAGRAYAAGEIVEMTEEQLKRFSKKDYKHAGRFEKDIEETRDIVIEDKETVDITKLP